MCVCQRLRLAWGDGRRVRLCDEGWRLGLIKEGGEKGGRNSRVSEGKPSADGECRNKVAYVCLPVLLPHLPQICQIR